jgi:hypothetical protein
MRENQLLGRMPQVEQAERVSRGERTGHVAVVVER